MSPPTARQREVLAVIEAFRRAHGFAPSVAELGALIGVRSKNGTVDHLRALKRKGLLDSVPRTARTLHPTRAGLRELGVLP